MSITTRSVESAVRKETRVVANLFASHFFMGNPSDLMRERDSGILSHAGNYSSTDFASMLLKNTTSPLRFFPNHSRPLCLFSHN